MPKTAPPRSDLRFRISDEAAMMSGHDTPILERRAARAAPRGRGAAPTARQTTPHLARPGHPRSLDPAPVHGAATPSPRHPRHAVALASSPRKPPLDQAAPPTRPTAAVGGAPTPDRADGGREPDLGVSAHPWRTRAAGLPDRAKHRVAAAPPSTAPASTRRHAVQRSPGGSLCPHRPRACWRVTSSTSTPCCSDACPSWSSSRSPAVGSTFSERRRTRREREPPSRPATCS